MPSKTLLAVAALFCVFATSLAQTQSDDVVRISTNLVQVDVVVTKNGRPVKDLKAEDFEIFQDGRRQQITTFAYISNVADTASPNTATKDPNEPPPVPRAPSEVNRRTIAFVIDDLGMSAQSMADVRRQLRKFIDTELNPNDRIAIIRTSRGRREVPQFTNDRNLINRAWSRVVWNHCSRIGIKNAQSDPGLGCGYGAASFPETLRSIRSIIAAMGKVPGRKSMILFANHIPLREYETFERPKDSVLQADAPFTLANNYGGQLDKLSERAIRAGVVIYAVDAAGLQVTSLQASESTTMAAGSAGNGAFVNHIRNRSLQIQTRREGAALLAKETGGFMIKDQNEFQFDRILEDQSGYYLIGYRPSDDTFNKRFHKLKASVKKSGMTVRTRSGFFGMSEEEANRKK